MTREEKLKLLLDTGGFKMNLDEAIKYADEVAEEHRQLAEWLKELKAYKEQGDDEELDFVPEHKKIPCTMIIGKSCGDAISRQATFNLMRGLTRWCVKSEDGKWKNVGLLYDDVMFGIDRLPSVTPKPKTDNALKLLADWAIECGFGYDNIPEQYEKYKDDIVDMGYAEGLMYIAKMEVSNEDKPIMHYEELWDRLYNWLYDMRFSIAPDETVTDDNERKVRSIQVDLLDEIMEWMVDQVPKADGGGE